MYSYSSFMFTWHVRCGTHCNVEHRTFTYSYEISWTERNVAESSKKTLLNWTCFISTSITTQFVIHYVEQRSNMCGIDCWRMWHRVRAALYTCNALCPLCICNIHTIQHSYIHLCSPSACRAVLCRAVCVSPCVCHTTFRNSLIIADNSTL